MADSDNERFLNGVPQQDADTASRRENQRLAKAHGETTRAGISKRLAIPREAIIQTWSDENAESQIVYSTVEYDSELRSSPNFQRVDPDEADDTRAYYVFELNK